MKSYVDQYTNMQFNIAVENVPNGTPNTPFIYFEKQGETSTNPPNYKVTFILPRGKIGETGVSGAPGTQGKAGKDGQQGSIGSPGISEIPIQYEPYNFD